MRREIVDYADGKAPASAQEVDGMKKILTLSLPGAYETASAVMGTILTSRTQAVGAVEIPTLGAFQLCFVAGAIAAFLGVAITAAIPRRQVPEPESDLAEARTAA